MIADLPLLPRVPAESLPLATELKRPKWAATRAADMACNAPTPEEVFKAGVRHHHFANTAYPIGHKETMMDYKIPRSRDMKDVNEALANAYGHLEQMMVYYHVPFCNQRCQFCEYTVVDPKLGRQDPVQTRYIDALVEESRMMSEVIGGKDKQPLAGMDIGGGTPSMASSANIERIVEAAQRDFNLDPASTQISIETTPVIAAADYDKIKSYFDMGIRRISMGVQTTDFRQAEELGRDDANAGTDYLLKARDNIRRAGFDHTNGGFNVDLMYGFPELKARKDKATGEIIDREDPFLKTLRDTIDYIQPDHITLYRMRYKGTKMQHLMDRVGLDYVNGQAGIAHKILEEAGYHGLPGKNTFSRMQGNTGCSDYLALRVNEGIPYVGLGLGAQSFSHETLSYNLGAATKAMHQYQKSVELGRLPIQDLYHLPREHSLGKFQSVTFYFGGIDVEHFKNYAGESFEEAFPRQVAFLETNGLMEYIEDAGRRRFQLTAKGKQNYGGVIAQFYAPSVQNYLVNLPGGEPVDMDRLRALGIDLSE